MSPEVRAVAENAGYWIGALIVSIIIFKEAVRRDLDDATPWVFVFGLIVGFFIVSLFAPMTVRSIVELLK